MKIAILGGTGRIGEGLACRWAPRHEIYRTGFKGAKKLPASAVEMNYELPLCNNK
jgi:predicted dinucleotide-binding enzyme